MFSTHTTTNPLREEEHGLVVGYDRLTISSENERQSFYGPYDDDDELSSFDDIFRFKGKICTIPTREKAE